MPEDAFIITKTDETGRITYANRLFQEISGYPEKELLDAQHNIVRHPDMPRGFFKLLWDHLKAGHEFNGYLKNLCRDGSFYWVFANVTPSLSLEGELLGYYSVRRKPQAQALNTIQALYRDMLAAETGAGAQTPIEASVKVLDAKLAEHGVDYDQFVLTV